MVLGEIPLYALSHKYFFAHDRVCPFGSAVYLVNALKENGVDYKYFEMPHSGHGLQNDDKIYKQYMKAVEEYLDKYMPVSG
ncbi:MAG: prolyl oligopeptidase family serine peptidase [Lachnospiraceae bacterium]|nr:prolyl oligopeptidase family serine peptidase [Lachnospiraceae bacterium]